MKGRLSSHLLTVFILTFGIIIPGVSIAQLNIQEAWIRAVPPSTKMSAAYMTILNNSNEIDYLVSASAEICDVTEIHTVIKENSIMKMRPVSSITIPAMGKMELKMGGYHIMFIRLKHLLKPGENYKVILNFQKAGKMTIHIPVRKNKMKQMVHH